MRNIKRLSLIFFSLIGIWASFAIATRPQDPLTLASQKLKVETDAVFRLQLSQPEKTKVREFFGTDHAVNLSGAPYQKLLRQFALTKRLLEEGSDARKREAIHSGQITRAAEASQLYFDQQKRLYFNYLKNFHSGKAQKADWNQISDLSLKLNPTVGYALNLNDSKYMARYNLSHFQNESGNSDRIKYSISPQELSLLEQEALKEAPSENQYAKLIQLLTVRERMTNQWAIHRMLGGSEDRSYFYGCAKDLQSFHGDLPSNYYQTLWNADRSDELLLVKESLATATFNQAAASEAQLRTLYHRFFEHWPDFNRQMDSQGNADLAEAYQMQMAPFFKNVPLETIHLVEKKWSEKGNGQVNSNAVNAIIHANFVGDVWESSVVSDRIARAAFEYRVGFYADLLVNHARGSKETVFKIADVVNDPDGARVYAERLVRQELKSSRAQYLERVRAAVLAEWRKLANFEKVSLHRKGHLEEALKNLTPAMNRLAQADYVLKNIDTSLEQHRMEWIRSGKLTYLGKDFELAYLPAKGLLKDRIRLYTPDQLSLFFSKKMEFWKELGGFFESAGPNANQISKQVKALEQNRIVMAAVKRFFGLLAERYYERMTLKNLEPKSVNPGSSPLYDILIPVAQESYARFVKEIGAVPVRIGPQPQLKLAKRPLVSQQSGMLQDATRTQTFQKPLGEPVLVQAGQANERQLQFREPVRAQAVPANERQELIQLYLTAMSLMNLSEFASGKVPLVRERSSLALIPHSLMDVEHLLKVKSPEKNIAEQIVHSLLDQKIGAEVIKTEMMSENPFFNLRIKNEVDAPMLGTQLLRFYRPGFLDVNGIQKFVKQYVHSAARNSEGLVEEACQAKPLDRKNLAMRNIFRGSQNLRAELTRQDYRFKQLDQTLQLELRSPMEKLKDKIDPICTVLFWVTLIALSIYFGPVLWAGVNTAIASGTLGAFTLGASGALEAAGIAGGIKGAFATLLMGKASLLINSIFWAQMLVWTHVNCIELPDHLKYELRVAQSQVGMFSKAQISNEEIERFNQEVNVKKLTTYAMWPLQAGTLPFLVKGVVHSAKTVMGKTTANALDEMAANGIKESTEQVVSKLREKDLTAWINEEGRLAGTQKYLNQHGSLTGAGSFHSFSGITWKSEPSGADRNGFGHSFSLSGQFNHCFGA